MLGWYFIVTLPFFTGLVWSAILFAEYRGADPAKRMLAWFIVANTGLMMVRSLIITGERESFDLLRCAYIFFLLVVFPVGYIYIRRLTSPKPSEKKELWLLTPAVGASAAGVAAYFLTIIDWHPVELFARVILPIEVILMAVFGEMAIRDYRFNIENYYSDTTGMRQIPMYRLLAAYTILSLIKSVALGLGAGLNSDIVLVTFISLGYTVLIFAIAHVGSKTGFNAGTFALELEKEESSEKDYGTCQKLSELVEGQKLYLQPGLKITDVASELGTNRSYLSEYINRKFGLSFCDYINTYRVRHAMDLISKRETGDMTDIYLDSGFASEASFYRNFKKFAGTTPNAYRGGCSETTS